jgi:AraC family transcriptional regulator
MDYFERVQKAVDFMESHLTEEFTLEEVAGQVYCSLFHFHRIFQEVVGDSMKEYIRIRRLSLAGKEIVETDVKVIDLALKYGYETPEAFTKAFKKLNGISPSACKKRKGSYVFREKASVQIYKTQILKGGLTMNYKIVEKDAFQVIGRDLRVCTENGQQYSAIPQLWKDCGESGVFQTFESMPNSINQQQMVMLGICMECDGASNFTYVIGVEVANIDTIPDGMVAKMIPGQKYAVFTAKGKCPEAIQETWKNIYGKWFPASGHERADGPDFEWYDQRSEVNDENCEVDIYIPIK